MNTNFSVGEIIKEIVIALGLDVAVRKFTEVHGPEVAKHVIERVTDRVRNNLFVFIRGMKNQVASKNLLKWHESCKGTAGEEDRWVNIMGALYLAVKDDPKKWWIFEDLGTIKNKKDREQALYFLENDVVKQWFDKFKEGNGRVFESSKEILSNVNEDLDDSILRLRANLRLVRTRDQREELNRQLTENNIPIPQRKGLWRSIMDNLNI